MISALNGAVNLWQLQTSKLSQVYYCLPMILKFMTKKCREDLDWHSNRDMLFYTYPVDGGNPQVSTIDLNATRKDGLLF